ncbi:hypothetical protein BC833DRAFT_655925 [Globomyces pollinis-pini]|nr:hypothetical protein BC833DRAFT_655925 [Globomyces pollinis-pini]
MTRHSKNNTALGFFTSAEKDKLKGVYGTKSQRLGRDSQKPFDCCSLCLQTARSPVICPEGHLYCRECIYESILQQKKDIDNETRVVNTHNASVETEEQKLARLEEEKKLENFIHQETKMVTMEKAESSTKSWVPHYFVPELKQETQAEQLKVSKSTPQCTAGKNPHAISFKKLVAVKFKQHTSGTTTTTSCPVCLKSFILGVSISILKPCGDAICKKCIGKFIKAKKCPCCDIKCKEKDVVDLVIEGSGFAGAGTAEAKKFTTAFN